MPKLFHFFDTDAAFALFVAMVLSNALNGFHTHGHKLGFQNRALPHTLQGSGFV